MSVSAVASQVGMALMYYALLVGMMRLAGKRLAGQTATIDLIVLIALGVVIQSALLNPGPANALVFVITVFVSHRTMAMVCVRSRAVREFVRGRPVTLIREGQLLPRALQAEGMTIAELHAGLRRLGHDDIAQIRTAVLEETGHVSAIPYEQQPHDSA